MVCHNYYNIPRIIKKERNKPRKLLWRLMSLLRRGWEEEEEFLLMAKKSSSTVGGAIFWGGNKGMFREMKVERRRGIRKRVKVIDESHERWVWERFGFRTRGYKVVGCNSAMVQLRPTISHDFHMMLLLVQLKKWKMYHDVGMLWSLRVFVSFDTLKQLQNFWPFSFWN